MQRLGEILIEKGVLSLGELHTALEACHRTGGRLGTQLLEYSYVEEPMLLEALSRQLGVPNVLKVKLQHAPLEVRRMLPTAIGRRLQAVPFEDTIRGFKVAMTNPNDRAAIDEISAHLKKNVLPHVATETAVMAALGGAENIDDDWSASPDPAVVKGRRSGDVEGWSRLWEPPSFDAAKLFRQPPRSEEGNGVLLASFPGLEPLESGEGRRYEPVVDASNFSELLHRADHRDEIGALLARYAASLFDRVCLYSVHKQVISGWLARGRSVVLEDLQSFSVPVGEPSLFADVNSSDSYTGAIQENEANRNLVLALADPAPAEIVAVPIRVKQRAVAYAVCDDPGHPLAQERVKDLVVACRKAGVAFEVLILRKKLLA
ncbi:MAG: hypothetical protein V2I67_00385 [Thermoanaerobaculales bacterium]|jgi:hypothetical protein|nr:hypothetical protein [Thermoanaerobaculales bacterium]